MNMKNIKFPEEIKSDVIKLRMLVLEDAQRIFEIYSDDKASELDDWVPYRNIDESTKLICKAIEDYNSGNQLRYGIIDLERELLVGSCGVFGFDEWNKKCMVFYQTHHNEYCKGYATQSVRLLIKYLFEEVQVNRIEAYVTPGNIGSIKVLEKNGFIQEGLHREVEFYKGEFWDGILMAILKKDYFSI